MIVSGSVNAFSAKYQAARTIFHQPHVKPSSPIADMISSITGLVLTTLCTSL